MEETIDLRELIEIVLKGKWVIILCTIVAVIIAAIMSFWVIDPTYESKATVSVNNGLVAGATPQATDSYFNEVITPGAYIERIKSSQIIDLAIQKSNLNKYSVTGVQENMTVENIANTNLVTVKMKANSASDAKALLEALLTTIQESLLTEIQDRIHEDIKYYAAQSETEKENLEVLLKQYRQQAEALNLPKSLLLDAVISYNNQYILNFDQDHLSEMTDISEQDLIELNEVSNEVKTTASVYRDYSNKERQLSAFSEVFRVDNKLLTISAPVESEGPVSPQPLLNIAIALIVGLIAGTGIVLFRHYWKSSGQQH
ncbi:Wzz/FepE/Etk N-terminal domain-containing protein [Domibacillus indicus]|uniref:Wzz/FepE/Etk N-terminal domain-containing protein n=1 Tax=Domibacillus indicus TaxID=1437523 RepID=UPI000617DDE6|nr:Wzz/FepE/Etk N-terminal domain-containing protein [Domibacillus indicus]